MVRFPIRSSVNMSLWGYIGLNRKTPVTSFGMFGSIYELHDEERNEKLA